MENSNSIHEIIKALMDTSTPFPPILLYQLSDLSHSEARILQAAWNGVPLQRRAHLLEDLIELSESDNLMIFDAVGKIALEDTDPELVIRAIDLLFQSEDTSLVQVYLKLLTQQERPDRLRAAAANAFGPYVLLSELDDLDPELGNTIIDALLKAQAADPSDLVRRRALESLGYCSRAEVPPLLRSACAHKDPLWVESALFAIGKTADEAWESEVLAQLASKNRAVRIQAIHAAGELAISKARPALIHQLAEEQEDPELRHELIWALSQIGGEKLEAIFEQLLEETDSDEEAEWLEEALDQLEFSNDKEIFKLFDLEFDEEDLPAEFATRNEDYADDDEDYALEDDESTSLTARRQWQHYVDDDSNDEFEDDDDFSDEDDDFDFPEDDED